MKSWMSFLLPDDEYKEKSMLFFIAEGAIVLFLSLIGLVFLSKFIELSLAFGLLISIVIFLLYVSGRYILSGIEYTDITTEKTYKKELRVIRIRTIGFVVIFLIVYTIVIEVPNSRDAWFEILGLLVSSSFLMFISSYISLKRSFRKNKELL